MSIIAHKFTQPRMQVAQQDYRRRSQFLIGSLYGLLFFVGLILLAVQLL